MEKSLIYSAKAKYRASCAREALEKAAENIEEAITWLDFEDMSQTPDTRLIVSILGHLLAGIPLADYEITENIMK